MSNKIPRDIRKDRGTIILTSGRSGSTKLMNCLKKRSDIKAYGEIFNMRRSGIDEEIFDFSIHPEELISPETHNMMCSAKYLHLAMQKYDICKVLYCHIKQDLPSAIEDYNTIMLSRRNKFRCLVSLEVAIQTDVWHGHKKCENKIHMDLNKTLLTIKGMLRQEHSILKRYSSEVIYFEDDFNDSWSVVCDKLGVCYQPPCITTIPSNILAEDIVENYEELKELDREFYVTDRLDG
jgi:hypothetical protein